MIRNPAQIGLMRLGLPPTPCNFGGDSKSDSSTSTTNNTTNHTDYNDKRNVAQDSAVSLSGDANVVDRSTSNVTQFFDTSDRSTHFTDLSDRSTLFNSNSNNTSNSHNTTVFTDNSDRSVSVTDYGSVNASLGLLGGMSTKAFDTAGLMNGQNVGLATMSVQGAIDTLKLQSGLSLEATKQAFDLVRSSGANNLASSAAMIGMANNAIEKTQAAFQNASDGGDQKTVMYALGAIAVVGVAFAMTR